MTDATLEALDAAALRSLVRDLLPWLDARSHARFVNALLERAWHLRAAPGLSRTWTAATRASLEPTSSA